jgi:excisionase family DNA binding protein
MKQTLNSHEVLTLEEAARYLRVPKKKVQALAEKGMIPARQIEDSWRFHKSALVEWLRGKQPVDGRDVLLAQAGSLADDETLLPMLAEIYKARGRPEVEEGSDD